MNQNAVIAVAAVVLVGVGGYALLGGGGDGPTGDITEEDLNDFAQCLAENDATFYGAYWCPHCNQQKAVFGDAMQHVDYVECSPDGQEAPRAEICDEKQIESYPTWIIDGERHTGVQSLQELAGATGCELPR